MIPVAHAGHWIGAVAAVVPIVLVAAWIAFVTVRDRRRKGRRPPQSGSGAPRN